MATFSSLSIDEVIKLHFHFWTIIIVFFKLKEGWIKLKLN